MKNRDWIVIFAVFFAWVLAQSLIREAVGALLGLVIGILGLAVIAGVMWLVLRRRKAKAAATDADTTTATGTGTDSTDTDIATTDPA